MTKLVETALDNFKNERRILTEAARRSARNTARDYFGAEFLEDLEDIENEPVLLIKGTDYCLFSGHNCFRLIHKNRLDGSNFATEDRIISLRDLGKALSKFITNEIE